ncbi:unnamed protein product [Clonostachys byssicola]|uniref:Rap-GAP domain-containing protein n=1 Tax=Clonostachys byssicola TaxID=160290 RepID=A0A9N9YB47_9HYPO|nr:unnamed protein product [Clonostachys byssicola]
MSPPTGDEQPTPDSSRPGGLANVFRGLTASRSAKSLTLSSSSSSVALPVADIVNATPTTSSRLSPNTMDSFELLKNGSLSERISAANTLKYAVPEQPLNPVIDIWYAAKDLIEASRAPVARTAGWELLTECVKHTSSTDLERREYFQTLAAPANPEDFHLQLAAMVDLTRHGRLLVGFDYDLLPLLTRWLGDAYTAVRTARKNASSASRGSSRSARNKAVATGEEKNFSQLFVFFIDVIKFSSKIADDTAVSGLVDKLLNICMSTSVEEDLRSCISVFDALVTFGSIPNDKLKGCVQVLSSIHCIVPNLQKTSWHTIANLCKSHNGQATVRILLDALRGISAEGAKDKDTTREVRGSLSVLQKLLSKTTEKGYPAVPYALLADGLSTVVRSGPAPRVCAAVLQVINALFSDSKGNLHKLIVEEDWSVVLDVAAECAKKLGSDPDHPLEERTEDLVQELQTLLARLDLILGQKHTDFVPRQTIIKFFVSVPRLLSDTTAGALLNYFQELRCCSPSDLRWEKNLAIVSDEFFSNRKRSTQTRLHALRIIKDSYETMDLLADDSEQNFVPALAKSILRDITEEQDAAVLDAVMDLMIPVVTSCDMQLFDFIVGTIKEIAINDRVTSPMTPSALASLAGDAPVPTAGESLSNVVIKGYVKMFTNVMNSSCAKSVKLYTTLVHIAKSIYCEVDARLTAMKLLFRLRADWASRVFVTKVLETNFLAAGICRTEESLARRQREEAFHSLRTTRSDHGGLSRPARGLSLGQTQAYDRGLPVRTPSGSKPSVASYKQMWRLPDPDAIPSTTPNQTSPVLLSRIPKEGIEGKVDEHMSCVLDMPFWLETVLSILKGDDWEVYCFVLVHLPSQLSNHAIFKNALPQIRELRKLICEQIRSNSFQEPPNASGLRRADVAICLFHSLTMILSYHDHFLKGEEDEIVKTYVHGITAWERTAQCCIHALSICCHELPLSVSKSLGQMLNQMSTIITQSNLAIHILEFLACLSRLHDVYVNFREDEYRTIFGMCFRYLDYARDKRQQASRNPLVSEPVTPVSTRSGSVDLTHPSASDDLPQYVYALGYHVILFWFLALKLQDRPKHVPTITKKLFTEVDGSGTTSEEQALTTLDFMQRVAYADIEESAEDPEFNEQRFGKMATRNWVVGNSIVTVKQSLNTGWAQVTKRQPSGTSVYSMREVFRPPPLHQTPNHVDVSRGGQPSQNTVMPSHLLIQLMSSAPQSCDSTRPIPLPEDDTIERAIRMFDLNPTTDGHKVGVIYIGEGQTQELDILANVSGSSDYVEFLNNLGTLTKLKGATFNTQGLDREFDLDGQYTFCWRDRVTEIIFHVTTQMPTDLERYPQLANKKRHIGNDFVNIVFNDSGLPFKFDTFPSQFNYVYIVITPASRASFIASREAKDEQSRDQPFYRVQVMSRPGFPEISPASETKMISLKALPGFIRLVALNASVFSMVWQSRNGGEHVSAWRNRLREIRRLREKYGPKSSAASFGPVPPQQRPSPSPPPSLSSVSIASPGQQVPQFSQPFQPASDSSRPNSGVRESFGLRRTSVATFFTSSSEQASHRSSTVSGGTSDTEIGLNGNLPSDSAADSVDFSQWA